MNHSGNEKTDFILEWVMLTAVLKNGRILAAQHTNWEVALRSVKESWPNTSRFRICFGGALSCAASEALSRFRLGNW